MALPEQRWIDKAHALHKRQHPVVRRVVVAIVGGVLLLVACLIAILSRRLGLPYIVGLVVAGFLIALLPNSPNLPLSRELIFNILLPPLVFEAALQLEWKRFRTELPLTLTLAFLGVGIAAAVVVLS